jgi:hypothetical protein
MYLDEMKERHLDVPLDKISILAAKMGKLNEIKILHQMGCPWEKDTCCNAAVNGHLDILQWMHENGCPWSRRIEILQWLHENSCPWEWLSLEFLHDSLCCYDQAHIHTLMIS